jgi:hypothetical protein
MDDHVGEWLTANAMKVWVLHVYICLRCLGAPALGQSVAGK